MRHRFVWSKGIWICAGLLALGILVLVQSHPAEAAPLPTQRLTGHASAVTEARIYRRGRTPIYPYYYNPGRQGGWSFYFGFVPYTPGQVANEALQRSQYPQNIEWPPNMYRYGPRPGWGPKRYD
jgi:hypothetical protein